LLIKKKELKFFNNKFFYFFLIFYLYINLNSLNSFQPEISLKTSLTFVRIILFIFLISYFVRKYPKIIDFTYYCFLFCLLSLFIDSLFQFFFEINVIGQKVNPGDRISSFFGEELIMGSYVARLLPFIIGLSYLTRLKKKIFLNSVIIIISFALIILSGERTSFFYFIVFLFFYFFINKKNFYYLLLIISFITIIFGLFNSAGLNRIGSHTVHQYKESKYYLSYRHELHIIVAYQMFLDKKFFGHGLKSFRNLCSSPKYSTIVEEYNKKRIDDVIKNTLNISDQEELIKKISNTNPCNTHPHSIYLEFLAELGIVGFIFLSFLFLYTARKLIIYFVIIVTTKNENKLISGKYFILLGFLISMIPLIPSGSYFNNYMLIITYFPIGFYLSTKKI
jgi:O-antigen ligase